MKIFNKIISFIYFIIVGIVSLWVMVLPFKLVYAFDMDKITYLIETLRNNYIYSLLGIIVFLFNVLYLISIFKNDNMKGSKSFLVLENEYGEIHIYEETIIGLIDSVSSKFVDINDIKAKVKFFEGQIDISLKGKASNDISIPETSKDLQIQVKEHIEKSTGASVRDIKVEITNVTTSQNRVK